MLSARPEVVCFVISLRFADHAAGAIAGSAKHDMSAGRINRPLANALPNLNTAFAMAVGAFFPDFGRFISHGDIPLFGQHR